MENFTFSNSSVAQQPGEELSELFGKNPLMATVKLSRYKFVSKMLSADDVVLDIGCGSGASSYFFSKFCKSSIGVDKSDKFLHQWANLKSDRLSFLSADVFALKYPDDVSAIVALDFIEHFNAREGELLVKKFSEILAGSMSGGVFICGTPSISSSNWRANHNKEHHLHEYSTDELRQLCRKYFSRVFMFHMNDEVVHTGFEKLAWYVFALCVV